MKFLLSHMRAGSHLAAAILGCQPFVAHDEKTGEFIDAGFVTQVISLEADIWTYYPYNMRLCCHLARMEDIDCYMTLRDPRDIIVSTAHFCEKYPATFLNFTVDSLKFTQYPLERRIDFLIDDILKDSLFGYERWRQTGLFYPLYFEDMVQHPVSQQYENWKRRGDVGSHKDEMTPAQIERSTETYRELIEAWQKNL